MLAVSRVTASRGQSLVHLQASMVEMKDDGFTGKTRDDEGIKG
jgi:hypothetical protein